MRPPDLAGIRARVLLIRRRYDRMVPFEVLGTLGAAVLGCPFGFLAARNVVAHRLLHLLARRSLDTVLPPYANLRLHYLAGAGLRVSPASTEPSRPCGRKMMNSTSKVP